MRKHVRYGKKRQKYMNFFDFINLEILFIFIIISYIFFNEYQFRKNKTGKKEYQKKKTTTRKSIKNLFLYIFFYAQMYVSSSFFTDVSFFKAFLTT